jgi:uncharacterized delta-60 repeat protein
MAKACAALLSSRRQAVAVGDVGFYPNRVLELVRWDDDGVLDPTFGTGGVALHTLGGGQDCQPSDLALLPDGKLLVASLVATAPSTYTTALVRFLSNGALDTDFGVNGIVVAGAASIRTLELLPDGSVLGGGAIVGGTPGNKPRFRDHEVPRRRHGGRRLRHGGDRTCERVVLGLRLRHRPAARRRLRRDRTDQHAGPGFRERTLASRPSSPTARSTRRSVPAESSSPSADGNGAQAVLSFPDGGVLLAGQTTAGDLEFTLARYDSAGVLDPTFGTGGIVRFDYGASTDVIGSVALAADGEIIAAGYTTGTGFGAGRPTLARFKTNGTLQTSFGTGGLYRFLAGDPDVFSGDFERTFRLPDGRLLAAGTVNDTIGNSDFTLVRFIDDVCGNGIVEFSEQCDDGNVASDDCCSATCQHDAAGSPCGADGLRCTKDECDGAARARHR